MSHCASAQPQPAVSPLIIAVVATEGSSHQPHGADVLLGARDAIAALRRLGASRNGPSLALIERREDCTTDLAEVVARELVALPADQRPVAVVGHLCSGAAIAASRIYAAAGILMISPGARHPRLTDQRPAPLVFRLASREDRLPHDIAALITTRFSGRHIAFVHERSIQASTIVDQTEAQLRRSGVRPVLREPYMHGWPSYVPLIDRVIAANAQVMVMPTQPIEMRVMLAHLKARGRSMSIIAGDIVAAVMTRADAQSPDQQIIMMLPWLELPPPLIAAAIGAPAERGRSPTWQRVHAAIEALAHAASKAGSPDPAALVRALETETAVTVAGPIRFDTRGDIAIRSYVPWIWRDGGWQLFTE